MNAAIELFGAVYTTAGGTRYHADPACYALATGRAFRAARAGRDEGTALYALQRRSTISAVQFSYTACLVCVPAAQAIRPLPLVTLSYGHEPVTGYLPDWLGEWVVCARCEVRRVQSWTDEDDEPRRWEFDSPVPWPCTSAVVLGLAARDGA